MCNQESWCTLAKLQIAGAILSAAALSLLGCTGQGGQEITSKTSSSFAPAPISKQALIEKFAEEVRNLSEGRRMHYECDGGIPEPRVGATQSCSASAPELGTIHHIVRITALRENGDFSISLDVPPEESTPKPVPPLPTGIR
ncbi:hypothetical protein HNP40_001407 [Mycobacteroides chelonae]|nr:hypothetical protein [Mycobacteroides chelonae]